MTTPRSFRDRIPTGVAGLDSILDGGWLLGGVYSVQGMPGAGKTILGNQACFRHAADGGSAVFMTLLAESHARMLAHLERMTFYDASVIPDRLYYVSALRTLDKEGLDGLQREIRNVIESRRATLVVMDGLFSAREAAADEREFKRFIHALQSVAVMTRCVILLLNSSDRPGVPHPEHTVADGVIELTHELEKLRALRHLRVVKLRGSNPVLGLHSVQITNDGMSVSRRIETQLTPRAQDQGVSAGSKRLGFGVPGLDAMLRGGLPGRSITMVLGPSGSGKTILGLHWLGEGLRRKEPCVFFGFYEKPEAILEKAKRLGLPFEEGRRDGRLGLVWQPRAEGVIDVLGERLLQEVRERKAVRLFVDGMDGFQVASEFPERIRDVLSVVTDELEAEGVTTVYTAETRDLFGPQIEVPITGVSTITHNVVLLRHVELHAHVHRLISILKVRDSSHDSAIREFRIEDDGITVADTFQSAEQILSGTARSAPAADVPPDTRAKPEARSVRGKRR